MIIIIIIKIKRLNCEALETLRRPTAGQQGGVQGGQRPPPNIILLLLLSLLLSLIMIIIIIKIKRPNGEAPEISRRPKAGQQGGFGGAAPPRHNHSLQPKISAKRSSLSAGQRPASRGGAGGAAPPRPKLLHSPPANEFQAASRGCRGGSAPPPNIILLLSLIIIINNP